jgi:tetratricopeptide (TPR) repeat protein
MALGNLMNQSALMSLVILLTVVLIGTSGCSSTPGLSADSQADDILQSAEESAGAHSETEPAAPLEYPLRPFDKEVLYDLLVAEVAGYRRNYDLALENYAKQAAETRDAGVAARATRLAAYLKRDDVVLNTSVLWAEIEPDNIEAHRRAADQLTRVGNLSAAVTHMEAVKNLGGLANFNLVASRAENLDQQARDLLLATINSMLVQYPNDSQLLFSKAVLLEQSGRTEETLEITAGLLTETRDINVVVLRVNALMKLERKQQAIELLQREVAARPDHRRLKVFYARVLFDEDLLDRSRQQYEELLEKVPGDGDILFALALISMEQKQESLAVDYFNRMLDFNQRTGEAHYYLGTLMEDMDRKARALAHYKQAGLGYEFLPAQGRITSILTDQGRLDEALVYLENLTGKHPERKVQLVLLKAQLLSDHDSLQAAMEFMNEAIESDSDNIDYRYFRAMTGEKNNDLDILEADLRYILALEPENADAMNALGYTLTNKTDRHQEALELITRALELKPGEAAFIDSMGWVHYRLQNYDQALAFLRQALDLLPNDEVAAHLGEVLWIVGDRNAANEIWQQGLELAPDSEILKEVISRFK